MNNVTVEVVLYMVVAVVCAAGLLFSAWTVSRARRTRFSAERVQVITAQPGDAVVVTYDRVLTQDQRKHIIAALERRLPAGVMAMVLDGGLRMSHVVKVSDAHV